MNFSMIMMGMFEGAFAEMAAGLAEAVSKTADAMAEAFDGKKAKPSQRETHDEVAANVKVVFAKLRGEVASGITGREAEFGKFIRDPSFDKGIEIVESHDFAPRLTEKLTDADLGRYVSLIQREDPEMAKMMNELGAWQKTTPRFDR